MAQYYNITREEVDAFLTPQGFALVNIPGTSEIVYGKRVDQNDLKLTLRVYTGINFAGNSRDVGDDAIRVVLFLGTPTPDGKMAISKLGGSKRVHRVIGWKRNLQSRLDGWIELLPKNKCVCGGPMVVRDGKYGKFLSFQYAKGNRRTEKAVSKASR